MWDQLPFKVAVSSVAAIMQSMIRCLQFHPKLEIWLPLQVAQETNCSRADPSRWQHYPNPVTQLQVHGGVGDKNSVMPLGGGPPWSHTGGKEGSVRQQYHWWKKYWDIAEVKVLSNTTMTKYSITSKISFFHFITFKIILQYIGIGSKIYWKYQS